MLTEGVMHLMVRSLTIHSLDTLYVTSLFGHYMHEDDSIMFKLVAAL